jgi:prepilin-type N-terminal cleavage/methylation domain-containing protein
MSFLPHRGMNAQRSGFRVPGSGFRPFGFWFSKDDGKVRRFPRNPDAGFSLIEVLVALAILGMAGVVLLDAHYGALGLFADTQDEVLTQNFMDRAVGEAEIAVMAGSLSGGGDFGAHYPDYAYSFTAQLTGEQQTVPLYTVMVVITGPKDSRNIMFMVYNIGQ